MLKLMYAALIRASETWRRVVISEFELKQLEQLREHLNARHAERTAPAIETWPDCVKHGGSTQTVRSDERHVV